MSPALAPYPYSEQLPRGVIKITTRTEGAPRYNIVTLGCEKNSVDSEGMGQLLAEAGYDDAARPEDADILIVNTCGFLQASTGESVAALQKLAAGKRDGQLLVAAGCATQRY